jgi:hypothetical protein
MMKVPRPGPLTLEEAETIGIRAVGFLAEQPDLLQRFLDLSGLDVADLRSRVQDPALLGAILDFILFDETLTRAFAEAAELAPDAPARARSRLPGMAVGDS